MDIMVTNHSNANGRISYEMTSGTKTAYVSSNAALGVVDVLCMNASHRAWRGMGRTFGSWTEAKAAYKSADMKAMIEYAEDASTPQLKVVG